MQDFVDDFKAFVMRGNVLDLAVAVVLGAAFISVVNSFVKDVVMQIVAAIGGQPAFTALTIDIGDGRIYYGSFITAVVNFLIVAFVVFLVVRLVTALQARRGATPAEEAASAEVQLLTEIRDQLREQR